MTPVCAGTLDRLLRCIIGRTLRTGTSYWAERPIVRSAEGELLMPRPEALRAAWAADSPGLPPRHHGCSLGCVGARAEVPFCLAGGSRVGGVSAGAMPWRAAARRRAGHPAGRRADPPRRPP